MTTRREIAETLAQRIHFNTYGGNPVSMAAGLAVLDAVEADGLQENCRVVGGRFKAGLLALMERHPLIGDVKYGKGEHNRLFRERFGLHRLALHALELRLAHPGTGEPLTIVAPVPEDLAGVLRALGMAVPSC